MIRTVLISALLVSAVSQVAIGQVNSNDVQVGCRQALNRQLARDNRGSAIRSTLRSARERGGGDQLRVIGEAEVSIDGRPRRMVSFECVYNLRGDFPESVNYNYADGENQGGGSSGGGWQGADPGRPRPGGRGINLDALPGFAMRRGGRGGNIIELKMQIDGMVDIFIRNDQLRYDVINGQPPTDQGTVAGVFLPRRELECLVEKRDGRAEILVIDQPSRLNNFTLHLQINDRSSGSDRYEARITW
ncbi:MAG: hypothetical protein EBU88_04895 [Acidobacteria bacterium]|nr:hypothetical protein [Acidobacteriota bacterium]